MSEILIHDKIAQTLQEQGGWFAVQSISEKFEINIMNAHSAIKRIESCGAYNIELKKEAGLKYIRVLPNGVLTKGQQLTRLALFGVPIERTSN